MMHIGQYAQELMTNFGYIDLCDPTIDGQTEANPAWIREWNAKALELSI